MALGLFIRDGSNVPREITELVIRDGSNVARTITAMYVRDTNNVSRLVYNPSGSVTLRVDVLPPFTSGFTHGTGVVTTGAVTATGSGGTAPYTYAWTLLSHSAITPPTADSPTSAVTTFTQTGIAPSTAEDASWQCTVTDDNGNTANSDPVDTTFVDITT